MKPTRGAAVARGANVEPDVRFLLLDGPLAASLTQSGLALRKPRVEFQHAHPMARASSSNPAATSASDEQFADSSSAELLQSLPRFGLGLTAASTLVALVGAALVVLVLYLVFTY